MSRNYGVIMEPSREIPVVGEYEVVVVGGGPAGILAAATAARAGRSTILIESYGFLGGAGTAAGVSGFCGLYAKVYGEFQRVVRGRVDELLERIHRLGGLRDAHITLGGRTKAQAYDTAAFKMAADDMVITAGAEILFHAKAVAVAMAGDASLHAVIIESKSGRAAIVGKVFIDCSGDGDIAAWAGVPYEKGDPVHGMLYPTTRCRINNVDPIRAGEAQRTIPKLMEKAAAEGWWTFPRRKAIILPQKNPIEWRMNATQVGNPDGSPVDGTDVWQLSHGEIEGRRQVRHVFEFIRRFAPGFENSYIVDLPPQIGIRETRRIVGEYQLTEEDVLQMANFPDSIGVNSWPIEAHEPGDVVIRWPHDENGRGYNQLPYRMIVPKRVRNLLVAGRCASMTHYGQSAARVSGACFVMGQAAGMAADLALRSQRPCRDVDTESLRRSLARDGAFLG
jgi:hypothetical protein